MAKKPDYLKVFDDIIALAGGADLGKFMNVRGGIIVLGQQANAGDESAKRVLKVLLQFSALLDILGKETK